MYSPRLETAQSHDVSSARVGGFAVSTLEQLIRELQTPVAAQQLKINEFVVALARQDTDSRTLVDALRQKFVDQEQTVEKLQAAVAELQIRGGGGSSADSW